MNLLTLINVTSTNNEKRLITPAIALKRIFTSFSKLLTILFNPSAELIISSIFFTYF